MIESHAHKLVPELTFHDKIIVAHHSFQTISSELNFRHKNP